MPYSREANGADPRRVVCVDGQRTVAEAVAVAINHTAGLECVGTAWTAENALRLALGAHPDVLVVDVITAGTDAVLVRRVKRHSPRTRVVVLADRVEMRALIAAAGAGADAFLPKDTPLEEVLDCIRSNDGVGLAVGAATAAALAQHLRSTGLNPPVALEPMAVVARELTERERDVLVLLAEGLDVKGIADHLGITVHTCRGYLRTVMMKLGAHSQVAAVVLAARSGIVDLRPTPDASMR